MITIDSDFHCRYYHNEKDIEEECQPQQIVTENVENNNDVVQITVNDFCANIEDPIPDSNRNSSTFEETDSETVIRDLSEEKSRLNVLTEINIEAKNNRNAEKIAAIPQSNASTPSISLTSNPSTETETEPKPSCSTETTSLVNRIEETPTSNINAPIKNRKMGGKVKGGISNIKNSKFINKSSILSIPKINTTEASTSNVDCIKVNKLSLKSSSITNQNSLTPLSLSGRDSSSDTSGRYSSSAFDSARCEKKKDPYKSVKSTTGISNNKVNRKLSKIDTDKLAAHPLGNVSSRSPKRSSFLRKMLDATPSPNINISSEFCKDSNQMKCDEQSNMFLYIDLHGHASKKGVFMYGNYLPKIAESVECMLLPRLMSLNSHHFHFDACVFSERNMYHKYAIFTILCLIQYCIL